MEQMKGNRNTPSAYEDMDRASALMRGYILELLIKEAELEEKQQDEVLPAPYRARRKRQRL